MHSSVQLFPALPEGVQGTFGRGLLDSPRPARRPPGGGAGPLRKRGIFLNTTTNYQLCQWEGTDRILMEDFNYDNQKIDAALKATADAVPCVKLGEQTTATAANAVTLDLTGLDFSAYDGVRFMVESGGGTEGQVFLRLNGLTTGYEESWANSAHPAYNSGIRVNLSGWFRTVIDLFPFRTWTGYSYDMLMDWDNECRTVSYFGFQRELTPDQITSATLVCNDSGEKVPVGTKLTVYGLRW